MITEEHILEVYDGRPLTPLQIAMVRTLVGLHQSGHDDVDGPTSLQHLRSMCDTAYHNIGLVPDDKICRWIGYIQGVLAARGLLDVDAERDRTRPFYHEAYKKMGLAIPELSTPAVRMGKSG